MDSPENIGGESWVPIIKPYLEKVMDWDEISDGDFVDFALKQMKFAMAMREENDRASKEVLYNPFYKQECDVAVMCAFFYAIFYQVPVDTKVKKVFEDSVVSLADSRGYDTIYVKNRLMEVVGSPIRFVKAEKIDDFIKKRPYFYN